MSVIYWYLIIAGIAGTGTSATVFPHTFKSEAACLAVAAQVKQKSTDERNMASMKAICVSKASND